MIRLVKQRETSIVGRRVTVIVTTDGGRDLNRLKKSIPIKRGDTVLDALQSVADVRFAPDGLLAQVNGYGGGALTTFGPDPSAWFYRVDGIESSAVRPERFKVKPGQSVWWDLRRFDLYERLPVAVCVFPEPLFSGYRSTNRELTISYGSDFKKDAEFFRTTSLSIWK